MHQTVLFAVVQDGIWAGNMEVRALLQLAFFRCIMFPLHAVYA